MLPFRIPCPLKNCNMCVRDGSIRFYDRKQCKSPVPWLIIENCALLVWTPSLWQTVFWLGDDNNVSCSIKGHLLCRDICSKIIYCVFPAVLWWTGNTKRCHESGSRCGLHHWPSNRRLMQNWNRQYSNSRPQANIPGPEHFSLQTWAGATYNTILFGITVGTISCHNVQGVIVNSVLLPKLMPSYICYGLVEWRNARINRMLDFDSILILPLNNFYLCHS